MSSESTIFINNKENEHQKCKNTFSLELIENFILYQNQIIKLYHNVFPTKTNEFTDYYAVIVEPRSEHLLLEAVCRNIKYFLPDNWNLIVYSHNEDLIRERLKNIDFKFYKTHKESFTPEEYSELLMSLEFWNNIPGENVLIFQTDSFITKKFTYSYIENIKKYPFIGAVYRYIEPGSNDDLLCFDKKRNFSMSGGFSFRKKSVMIDCINKIKIQDIVNYMIKNNMRIVHPNINYEDFYFQSALHLLNYELPSYEDCSLFCLQEVYYLLNSHAIHGIYRNYVYSKVIFHLKPPLSELHDEIMEKIVKI